MVITPSSDVILLKCPLELSQDNQLSFTSKNNQYNYFYGLPKLIAGTNFTYQRKDSTIRVPIKYDSLVSYNYVMYRNEAYSDKWFYAFIEKMEYVNDNMTAVSIKTDSFQTWQFDLEYKRTFVEREHVNDDTIGKHTVPEGLDLGEPLIVDHRDIPMYPATAGSDAWVPCFCVSALPEGCSGAVDGRVKGDNGLIGGVFSTLKFFATHTLTAGKAIIQAYEQGSVLTDAIINVYMVPKACVNETITSPTSLNGHSLYPLYNYAYDEDTKQLQEPTVLAQGYSPVNKKLFTSPFSYIYMSNNAGEDITLDWQDFPLETISGRTMPTISYYRYYVPSASISAKLIFDKYKNYESSSQAPTVMANYGVNFAKVPVCAWTTDYYTNWLTQNGVNVSASIGSAVATTALGVGVGLATGGVGMVGAVGSAVSGASSIANTLGEMHKAQTIPPQAHGNIATGDLAYSLKRNSISCYFMSVRKEVAQIIDAYFSMYGYKVSSVKVPNVKGRQNWNYVKTIGCYILADIPQEDLQEIKQMFDNGLTIWHHANTFMDYSQPNSIV